MGKPLTANFRKLLLKTTLCAAFAAVAGPLLPQTAAAQETPAAMTEADVSAPEACAPTAEAVPASATMPEISYDFTVLSALPLTGSRIYTEVTDPANSIKTCLFPTPGADTTESTFENRTARIGRGRGASTAFHEYFHAGQFISGADDRMSALTVPDAQVFMLMKEASAVAFEMATRREAKNHGVDFPEPFSYVEKKADGRTMTFTLTSSATDPANKAVFDAAYDKAWQKGDALMPQDREAGALAAAGQALVRRLLLGKDADWKSHYIAMARENIANNKAVFRRSGTGAAYAKARAEAFSGEGDVSHGLNFIPPEYLGPGAAQTIARCRAIMGFAAPAAGGLRSPAAAGSKTPGRAAGV